MVKVDPETIRKIEGFKELSRKVDHLKSLVEQYAMNRQRGDDDLLRSIRRSTEDLVRTSQMNRQAAMAETANTVLLQARTGGSKRFKVYNFRESVAAMEWAVELMVKKAMREAQAESRDKSE